MTPGAAAGRAAALVDGVDVDAVAAAVRACRDVEDLHGGSPAELATYLPGRRLPGVRVGPDAVIVQVRARWDAPAAQVAAEVRRAVTGLGVSRRVDVVIGDVGDPPAPSAPPAVASAGSKRAGRQHPAAA